MRKMLHDMRETPFHLWVGWLRDMLMIGLIIWLLVSLITS